MARLRVFQLPTGRRDIEQCARIVGVERRRRRLRDDPKRFIFVHISRGNRSKCNVHGRQGRFQSGQKLDPTQHQRFYTENLKHFPMQILY